MIEKPISRLVQSLETKSFTVIGSPGIDGLGIEAVQTYAHAVAAAEGDFVVTLGGVAPLGRDSFYRTMAGFLDRWSDKPMHVVPGAGDGPAFETRFGHRNRAVITETFTLIMLDNSGRAFTDESLLFLRDTLAISESHNVAVAFHYPPPNRITGNSLSEEEWARFEAAAGVWRKRISLLIAGHSRTYFEDEIEGLTLIATGGGGAILRDMDRTVRPAHHVVEFVLDANGLLAWSPRELSFPAETERDAGMAESLRESFNAECQIHARHLLDAEEAARRGSPNLARLFRAEAESRLRQARNLRRILAGIESPSAMIEKALAESGSDMREWRQEWLTAAERLNDYQAVHVLHGMAASDIVNTGLFEKALRDLARSGDAEPANYHVCSLCGVVFTGFSAPDYCSECGTPVELIHEVK